MTKIAEDIYWVGYADWDLRIFHGYSTPQGSTYNAYLINDEQPTLIDTVKDLGKEDMIKGIAKIIDPGQIRVIVSNHAEMDHSGSIEAILEFCPEAEVVCSEMGAKNLKKHFHKDWKVRAVKTGDILKIGKRELSFVTMPMVHWPDSMATYCAADKILFPNDAFGQHYASDQRFIDEIDRDVIFKEAAKYYANIVMPYGKQVQKVLEAMAPLDIEKICPSHGLMFRKREDIEEIKKCYARWASHKTEKKVVIVYDTMWKSTQKIAEKLMELLNKENIPAQLFNLGQTHISDIVTEILSSKCLALGTSILNNCMLPDVASFLMYLKGLQPKGRVAVTFGSYGWSRVGFIEFGESLKQAGFELLGDGKYFQFVPREKDLEDLKVVVQEIKEKLKSD